VFEPILICINLLEQTSPLIVTLARNASQNVGFVATVSDITLMKRAPMGVRVRDAEADAAVHLKILPDGDPG
jgi:hypothetical protein